MSSRWKKKQRTGGRTRPVKAVSERAMVERLAGAILNRMCGDTGWISLESDRFPSGWGNRQTAFQQSSCHVTGELFVKPITGRYRRISQDQLRQMVADIIQIFRRAGHPAGVDQRQPLWMQAEYLDNMLDFELNPPCGCPSELRQAIHIA